MEKYYDSKEYYSFRDKNSFATTDGVKAKLKRTIKKIALFLGSKKSGFYSAALRAFLSSGNTDIGMNILDYGCGSGHFMKELKDMGFLNVKGYDPFLPKNVFINNELYLSNDISSFKNELWDVVTLNHAFEHVYSPIETLREIYEIMPQGGKLIMCFPVIDSYAFEIYRENWVQFDAPRHINLFTRKSFRMLIEQMGEFEIEQMYDNSFHFQFTGSNLYVKGLKLDSEHNSFQKRLFSPSAYRYHFLAKKLNRQNKGDQIVVTLRKM
jgi:SAM-dependent methyltransferase